MVDLDSKLGTECDGSKDEILASHAVLPVECHEIAKELDAGLHHLLHMIGVTRRFMENRRMNDAGGHYRPTPWSNHVERLAGQCEWLKAKSQMLQMHDRSGYGMLCQTVDGLWVVLVEPLTRFNMGYPFGQLGRRVADYRRYARLQTSRRHVGGICPDEAVSAAQVYKFVMAEGAKVVGPRWVREQGGWRLCSK
ncbi:hypothetical protein MMC18_000006 [Xylographa bjoerkii]|nr:hypothetical protein [Xylographa bjoerkii]